MGTEYDEWSNVGYKVLSTLDRINDKLEKSNTEFTHMNKSLASINTKMWAIGLGTSIGVALLSKVIGF